MLFWYEPPLAREVIDDYVTFRYRGEDITLRRAEKTFWDLRMSRVQKNAMWADIRKARRKNLIRTVIVDGKKITVKNDKTRSLRDSSHP